MTVCVIVFILPAVREIRKVGESLLPLLNGLTVILACEEETYHQSDLARLIENTEGYDCCRSIFGR